MTSIEETLWKFFSIAKTWNTDTFGHITKKKLNLIARLKGIQRNLEKYFSPKLKTLEKELRKELEAVLDDQELLWK